MLIFAESPQLLAARRGWGLGGVLAASELLRRVVHRACRSRCGDVHVFERGQIARDLLDVWGIGRHRQQGRDFNERLEHAVAQLRAMGYERVVIVGSDVPGLRSSHIRAAAAGLDSARLSLGRDHRGGCWIIALHTHAADLLIGITWGKDVDFAQLLARCGNAVVLPRRIMDLDVLADLIAIVPMAKALKDLLAAWLTRVVFNIGSTACDDRAGEPGGSFGGQATKRLSWQLPPPLAM